jgi:predicted AAA+ superfamily ATPase
MRIDEQLTLQNEWWFTEKVKEELAPKFKREIFQELKSMVDVRQVTILTGLRRVGKTTLFYQLIQELLNRIKPKNILYFSFDEKQEELKKVLDEYQKITSVQWKKDKIYVFFDELHKVKGWASKLKILYDTFPNIKFFVSGSSSVELEKEAYSNLVGRHYLIKISPLSLKEFFELKNNVKIDDLNLWRDELILAFKEYLKKPFPEIVRENDERRIMSYLRENVIGKIIYQDLPKEFKNVNEDLLLNLIEIFYQNPGMILNFDELSKNLHIAKKTLQKHLFYLKFSYLVRVVRNLRTSMLITSRKLQKVYPYHWSLIFGLYKEIDYGKLLESIVSSIIDAKFYYRKGNREIDFILKNGEILPIEVKSKFEIKGLLKILKKLKLKKGVLIYDEKDRKEEKFDDINIYFIPVYELAYYGKLMI